MMEHTAILDTIKVGRVHTVTMATDSFSLLRARRKEIASEMLAMRVRMDALEAEDKELEAAEKTLIRLGAVPPNEGEAEAETMGKPPGTPTTPNMILALLREATAQGKAGLEPREMMISISKRWWPAVKSDDVGPTCWRMWKEGRVAKNGSVYMLKDTAAADLLGEDPAAAG
jgi:hypothetical protein